ncbi:PQQ-binding-like beta-propeller repeat protein [Candidatus Pacearchaeota archaeon]|nr:PQQ-binding-like beta-propeller repeat protein [Candidatus Pacearchaeota archaeon]
MIVKRICLSIISVFFLILFSSTIDAYSVGNSSEVHQYLTNESSVSWDLTPYEIKANLGNSLQTYNDDDNFDTGDGIITGSAEEDYGSTPLRHFWQPDDPNSGEYDNGLFLNPSSYEIAMQLWIEQVIPNYLVGNTEESYYWLGRVAHLLEDSAQPAHTHLDAHCGFFFCGGTSILEDYTGSNFTRLRNTSSWQGESLEPYNYEDLISNFDWSTVEPTSPLQKQNIELFRLFWYTAQKTQYWASDDVDGNIIYRNLSNNIQNWQCSGTGSLNLWANESYTSCSNFINRSSDLNISSVEKEANATIPHAMKATAGLYRLFWDAVQIDWRGFQHDNRRTGHTIAKGDITSATKKLVWNSSGTPATDFFDSPTIADIDGNLDEGMELIVGTENAAGTEGRVYALDGRTNTQLWSFNDSSATHAVSIDDIDNDGKKEILVTDRKGVTWALNSSNGKAIWNYSLPSNQAWANVIEDIDNKPGKEIIFSEFNETILFDNQNYNPIQVRVYALDNKGKKIWESPAIDNGAQVNPATANLDNDVYPEVVVTTYFKVYVFDGNNGTLKWDKAINEIHSAPTIADVDNDNKYDIIVTSIKDGCIDVYNTSCFNAIYVLDASSGNIKWSNKSLDYGALVSAAVANLDNDDNLEIIVATNDGPDYHNAPNKNIGNGSVYAFDGATGNQQWKFTVGGKVESSPAIGDIDGDQELEIVFGAYDGKVYAIDENGNQEWTQNIGSYIFSSPAIGDLDGDGVAEIAVKHAGGIGENATQTYGGGIHRGYNLINISGNATSQIWPPANQSGGAAGEGESSVLDIIGGLNNKPSLNNLTNITANKTDLINLNATGQIWATDSDNDTLTFYYSSPFNSSGHWQTTKNDSGNYSILVEVSDGNLSDWQVIRVEVIDRPPTISTKLLCNEALCTNNGTFYDYIDINCSGSVEMDGDEITYSIDALYIHPTSVENSVSSFINSLPIENLTFTGNQNKTKYLQLPKYANVTYANLTLKGFPSLYVNLSDGSDGELVFTTTTKSYGNLVEGRDYTVSGNTLYLTLDRLYKFTNFTLGSGTTLTTNNNSGVGMFIKVKDTATIQGMINLSDRVDRGQGGGSFTLDNVQYNFPNVANGGSAFSGHSQGGGFGGGGDGGYGYCSSSSQGYGGSGVSGGTPLGSAGSGGSCSSTCANNGGSATGKSAGGGGGASSYNSGGCSITAQGGSGGNSYGSNGGDGSGSHSGSCTYCRDGGGGGGAGGIAGKSGLHFVLKTRQLNFAGVIDTSGTSGGIGGNGGKRITQNGEFDCGGYGGGAGGGGNAGNVEFVYISIADSGTKIIKKGFGGEGGDRYCVSTGWMDSGNDGSDGSEGSYSFTKFNFLTNSYLEIGNIRFITELTNSSTNEINGTVTNLNNAFDNDWATQANFISGDTSYLIEKWTITESGNINNIQWKFKVAPFCGFGSGSVRAIASCYDYTSNSYIQLLNFSGSCENKTISIPNSCIQRGISSANVSTRIYQESNTEGATAGYFESSIFYNTPIWAIVGEFNGVDFPNKTKLVTAINSALNNGSCSCTGCILDGDNCLVPFLFHSDTEGKLEYSSLNITYQIPANASFWDNVGNHSESSFFRWNISNIAKQSEVDLKCKAVDIKGSNSFLGYYNPKVNLTISKNSPPTTPSKILCNNNLCINNETFINNIKINCSGSIDPDGDNINYSIDSFYDHGVLIEIKSNSFNNSLESEELVFMQNGNILRHLSTPKDANITLANINISGLAIKSIDVTENISKWNYTNTTTLFSPANFTDGNYSTSSQSDGSATGTYEFYINYSLPIIYDISINDSRCFDTQNCLVIMDEINVYLYSYNGFGGSSARLQVQCYDGAQWITVTDSNSWAFYNSISSTNQYRPQAPNGTFYYDAGYGDCYRNDFSFFATSKTLSCSGRTPFPIPRACTNSNSVLQLRYIGSTSFGDQATHRFTEESISYNSTNYPTNPYIEIGTPNGAHEWSYEGKFNLSNLKTNNLVNSINSALNNSKCNCGGCESDGYICKIPFLFHSDTAGILKYGDININYTSRFKWENIGNHSEYSFLNWNISSIIQQSEVDLRCRAIDPAGRNMFSSYYEPPINLTIGVLPNDTQKFIIQNSSGNKVAWLGSEGNIVLKGNCNNQTICTAPTNSFKIKNASGDVKAYIDSATGNMCIESSTSCQNSDEQTNCNSPNPSFIIQNQTGSEVIVIDRTNGNLCLTGKVYENQEPI